ncbi:murein hydrolase activator EnvC family protein [Rummeliibacillus stabekisii]|uniref:murein hydrolase activator EnvC family protein n=1 Tax=Rummeliibacillus stabekisii TaxID=241244 RepID=UPI0011740DEB|nr:M23 family metallopeptidase [Rummeliibacillus stabekisii]MBB5169186.1 peptidoglycan hydrolase CwlO-like protein [Rummeliibacillus stabekisii]GEL03446.1 peptidase [Rummeliibacillus stabekisii]
MKAQSQNLNKFIAATLALTVAIPSVSASAESLNDLKTQQQELNQKKSDLSSNIKRKSSKINQTKSKIDVFMNQINKLNSKINNMDKKINKVLAEIESTTSYIEKLNASITKLEKNIKERDALLKDRARSIQENGGSVSYVDVLLGSDSFVDFIDRISAVNTLVAADRDIINEQKNDKKKLEEQKKELKQKLVEQQNNRDQLKALRNSLESQKKNKNKVIDRLEAEQAKLLAGKRLAEKEYSEALTISKKVQASIVKEQARLAKVARQEAERARQVKSARQTNSHVKKPSIAKTASVSKHSEPAISSNVSSGTWTRPTTGTITSNSGVRDIGAGAEVHYGTDIANVQGTPIVAAADGVVFRASPLSTYGNVIMITHSIDGHIWTTVYGHLSGYNTSVGQSVKKGQVIGYMGSTGRSTGSHLHFEMHNTSWQGQKVGLVNPLRYISF